MQHQFMFPNLKISRKLLLAILSASALGLLLATGQAAPLYQTSGQTNPTVAMPGTVLNTAGVPAPVTSAGNDGENYWRLHQEALAGDFGGSYYRKDLAAGDTSHTNG